MGTFDSRHPPPLLLHLRRGILSLPSLRSQYAAFYFRLSSEFIRQRRSYTSLFALFEQWGECHPFRSFVSPPRFSASPLTRIHIPSVAFTMHRAPSAPFASLRFKIMMMLPFPLPAYAYLEL